MNERMKKLRDEMASDGDTYQAAWFEKGFDAAHGLLMKDVSGLLEALKYYEDADGGPYAPGDYHTADGGKKAYLALADWNSKHGGGE